MATASNNNDDWCTIESDPGVFTELLEELGCKSVEFEELWSLDEDSITQLKQSTKEIYGFIFLFEYTGDKASGPPKTPLAESDIPSNLFFAHQIATNACATQAILSVVLNSIQPDALGPTLSNFLDFTKDFPSQLKGVAISSQETIQKVHNSFTTKDSFLQDEKFINPAMHKSQDVFHFVAYVPHDGKVYELDGLQSGPIVTGEYATAEGDGDGDDDKDDNDDGKDKNNSGWIPVACSALQKRMQQETNAIKFNCMAVLQDKRLALQDALDDAKEEEAKNLILAKLQEEEMKRKQWSLENQRRKHNYVPLCIALLKELARNNQLEKLTKEAKERKKERLAAKRKSKEDSSTNKK